MPAKYVIHTVGPVWRGGKNNEAEMLAACYSNSLRLAEENQIRSIAFPSISTGVYGFPIEKAAKIAVQTVRNFIGTAKTIESVIFVCFSECDYALNQTALQNSSEQSQVDVDRVCRRKGK